MALISVIVPVYNVDKYLNRCVDSILGQTFTNFELVLVDDGSTDRSASICDEYAEKDSRIHVIHQQNGGLSAARNAGIDWMFKSSKSEWITFIDSDDWVHQQFLELLYSEVIKNSKSISMCLFFETDSFISHDNFLNPSVKVISNELAYVNEEDIIRAYSCGKLFKTSLFETVRFPCGRLWEDLFTTYKLLFAVDDVVLINEKLYYYYKRNDSIVNKPWTPRNFDSLAALKEQYIFFSKINNVRILSVIKKQHIVNLYDSQYKKLLLNKRTFQKMYYLFIISNKTKSALIKYKKDLKINIANSPGYYELAFPIFMKLYWYCESLKNKLKR